MPDLPTRTRLQSREQPLLMRTQVIFLLPSRKPNRGWNSNAIPA